MNNSTTKTKVSIITACYNNVQTIGYTLSSVLSQTFDNIEFIVIDSCSTDGTLELINKRKSDFKSKLASYKIVSEKDKGIADAWNKGLKLATGDVIFFLNSDDWIHQNTVETAVNSLNIYEKELVYGICNRVDEKQKLIGSFQKQFFKYRVLWNFGFSFTTCFCTKKVFETVGGFDTNYKIAIDSDFLLRCVKKNVKFIKGNHQVFMRIGGVSTKYRRNAHKEYRKALINNGYSKILSSITYFFYKFL